MLNDDCDDVVTFVQLLIAKNEMQFLWRNRHLGQ
jgi:hypothetical protein